MDSFVKQTKISASDAARKVAKQIAREPIELLKTSKSQVLRQESDTSRLVQEMVSGNGESGEISETQKVEIEAKKRKRIEELEEELKRIRHEREKKEEEWIPKTKLGKEVKEGKIKDIDFILESGKRILEAGIVDTLLPNLHNDLIAIGQSKGKFGGGKRRAWRQTQKKTAEENIPSFSCMAVIGDENGHVGFGMGKARETLPAREKALRKAKLGITKIKRGCGSFDCVCGQEHSIPLVVNGKCGSTEIKLIPAPKGTGLAIEDECKKVLRLVGISDIYSKTEGQTKTKFNLITALINALEKTTKIIKK